VDKTVKNGVHAEDDYRPVRLVIRTKIVPNRVLLGVTWRTAAVYRPADVIIIIIIVIIIVCIKRGRDEVKNNRVQLVTVSNG